MKLNAVEGAEGIFLEPQRNAVCASGAGGKLDDAIFRKVRWVANLRRNLGVGAVGTRTALALELKLADVVRSSRGGAVPLHRNARRGTRSGVRRLQVDCIPNARVLNGQRRGDSTRDIDAQVARHVAAREVELGV